MANNVETGSVPADSTKSSLKVVFGAMTLGKQAFVQALWGPAYTTSKTAPVLSHKPDDHKRGLADSLKALQTDKVDLWYLHKPDKLCERNGWKKPDVYQGCYHALQRSVEPELFTCLRHYNIAFYAFSLLAGSLLTDKYQRNTTEHENGSRYDPNSMQGMNFRRRYWTDANFAALDVIRPVAHGLGLTTAEAALRWLSHHSSLKKEHGDAIITGASSSAQLEKNLVDIEKDLLPEELVKALDKAWAIVKGQCGPYHM